MQLVEIVQTISSSSDTIETVRSLIDRDVIVPIGGEYRMVGDVGTLHEGSDSVYLSIDAWTANRIAAVCRAELSHGVWTDDSLASAESRQTEIL